MKRLARLAGTFGLSLTTVGCGSIPYRTPPADPVALPATQSGVLYDVTTQIGEDLGQGESAFWLLDRAAFSLEARLACVDLATRSLDIQYFIWEGDPSSMLFAHRVWEAAERGVRVRILLDDLTLNPQEGLFAALAKHPNISVRTFNPWRSRRNLVRVAEYFAKFGRLNHRMHNKTIIADGQVAMLGGRNIGDRYFGLWEDFVQNDLDVMTVGPAAADVADSFDLYWNSALSYAVSDVARPKVAAQELAPTLDFIRAEYLAEQDNKLIKFPTERDSWETFLNYISENFSVGVGRLEQDLPDVYAARPTQLNEPILAMLRQAQSRVLVSAPYLVPDQELVDLLAELVRRGVKVTLLTNSLASNNHIVAQMAYKPWRRKLLDIGVELYEARDDSIVISEYSTPPIEPAFLGLHSKAIVVDDDLSFIGSPNIDPRSLVINTEIGFFVESEDLAGRLAALIERDISPDAAWHVYEDERGRLRWESSAGLEKNQPALGFIQRVTAFFINLLPLNSQA